MRGEISQYSLFPDYRAKSQCVGRVWVCLGVSKWCLGKSGYCLGSLEFISIEKKTSMFVALFSCTIFSLWPSKGLKCRKSENQKSTKVIFFFEVRFEEFPPMEHSTFCNQSCHLYRIRHIVIFRICFGVLLSCLYMLYKQVDLYWFKTICGSDCEYQTVSIMDERTVGP